MAKNNNGANENTGPDYGGGGKGEGNVAPDLSDSFLESAARFADEQAVKYDVPKKG